MAVRMGERHNKKSRQHRKLDKGKRFSSQLVMVYFLLTSKDSISDQLTSVLRRRGKSIALCDILSFGKLLTICKTIRRPGAALVAKNTRFLSCQNQETS
ncbi:hypothetical protein AVEN_37500-1 [Araneus ventricosus]|uniref:Uncharacterized protein n=1 Tax=Araneus ventricosus TaxID=182803 RepID=A0A4Y2NKZ7_ARAVE|nr:hypothetical protein AVEN_226092-1 [Araneus ventricosus]GBN39514.1 hypothetical protein AVEN_37500-1 [Araneus ventricosus]